MFAQGWLVASIISHPAVAFPVGAVVTVSCLHFYNVTATDVFWRIAQFGAGGLAKLTQWIHYLAGEPGLKTAIIMMLMYLAVLCGLSTLAGCAYV